MSFTQNDDHIASDIEPYDFNKGDDIREDNYRKLRNSNPWFFYEDLDLESVDNVSHNSRDRERINKAMEFLEGLANEDDISETDSAEENTADYIANMHDILQNENRANTTENYVYNGPYLVNFNIRLLLTHHRGRPWKQSFCFIYPEDKKVVLHYGTNIIYDLIFDESSYIKRETTFNDRVNTVQVEGVYLIEDNKTTTRSRKLVLSFQHGQRLQQALDLLSAFINLEPKNAGNTFQKRSIQDLNTESRKMSSVVNEDTLMKNDRSELLISNSLKSHENDEKCYKDL